AQIAVEANGRQFGGQVAADVDVGLLGRRHEEVDQFLDDIGQVARLTVEVGDTGETKEIIGYFDEAFVLGAESLDLRQGAFLAGRLAALEVPREQVEMERQVAA